MRTVAAAKCWRWRGRWERGGPVFGASRFQGMGSCPELTGIGSGRERDGETGNRERARDIGSRPPGAVASLPSFWQNTSYPGRIPVPRAPRFFFYDCYRWFQHTRGSPIKSSVSSSPDIPGSSILRRRSS